MNKMTFKEFLTEIDVGDLQLQQQAKREAAAKAEEQRARGAFTQKAAATFPNKGDVVQTSKGQFFFAGSDKQNVYLQQIGGERKTQGFPHGTLKFRATGEKTPAGKPIFKIT